MFHFLIPLFQNLFSLYHAIYGMTIQGLHFKNGSALAWRNFDALPMLHQSRLWKKEKMAIGVRFSACVAGENDLT